MATLTAAQVEGPPSSLSSFLRLACKSLPVVTLDYVLGQVPVNAAHREPSHPGQALGDA